MSRRGNDLVRCVLCSAPMILYGYDVRGQVYRCEHCNVDARWMQGKWHIKSLRLATPEPPLSDAWSEAIEALDMDDDPAR